MHWETDLGKNFCCTEDPNNDLVGLHDPQMEDIYNHLDSYLATWGIRVESGFNQSTNRACLV